MTSPPTYHPLRDVPRHPRQRHCQPNKASESRYVAEGVHVMGMEGRGKGEKREDPQVPMRIERRVRLDNMQD